MRFLILFLVAKFAVFVRDMHVVVFTGASLISQRSTPSLFLFVLSILLWVVLRRGRATAQSGDNLSDALRKFLLNGDEFPRIQMVFPAWTPHILGLLAYPRALGSPQVRRIAGLTGNFRPVHVFRICPAPNGRLPIQDKAFVSSAASSVIFVTDDVRELTTFQRFTLLHEIGHVTVIGAIHMATRIAQPLQELLFLLTVLLLDNFSLKSMFAALVLVLLRMIFVGPVRLAETEVLADTFGMALSQNAGAAQTIRRILSKNQKRTYRAEGTPKPARFIAKARRAAILHTTRMYIRKGPQAVFQTFLHSQYRIMNIDIAIALLAFGLGYRVVGASWVDCLLIGAVLLFVFFLGNKELLELIEAQKVLELADTLTNERNLNPERVIGTVRPTAANPG